MNTIKKQTAKKKALSVANKSGRAFRLETQFEGFLRNNLQEGNEFRLVVTKVDKGGFLEFYCHPIGRDGSTYDGYVNGFDVMPKKAIDNLMKYLREKQ